MKKEFVLCIDNTDHETSLITRKVSVDENFGNEAAFESAG